MHVGNSVLVSLSAVMDFDQISHDVSPPLSEQFSCLEEIPEVYFLFGRNFQTQFTVASIEFDVSPGFMRISYSEKIAHIRTGVGTSVYLCVRVCEVYYIHYYLCTYVYNIMYKMFLYRWV